MATAVPTEIYRIPASSPIHYVTYVHVYGFTPQVVYVGYTPGYMGTVVTPYGTVVYGTGMRTGVGGQPVVSAALHVWCRGGADL